MTAQEKKQVHRNPSIIGKSSIAATEQHQNYSIAVKDPATMDKRKAFQQTIEIHKKMGELRPMAIFQSGV